jgi:hypothetical protein
MRNKLLFISFLLAGILYAPSVFAANVYWFGGTGNWNDPTNHWSNNSGNIPASLHGAAPGADDNCIFDTLSNATAYTVTINAAATCVDYTVGLPLAGVATIAGTSGLTVYGNYTLATGTIYSHQGATTFASSTGTALITTNGVRIASNFTINGAGRIFQLQDNLTFWLGNRAISLTAGTFDPQTYTVTILPGNVGPQLITGAWSFYGLTLNSSSTLSNEIQLSNNITVTNKLTLAGSNNTTRRLFISSTIRGFQRRITISGTSGNAYSNVDFQDIDLYDSAGQVDLSAITGLSGDGGGNNSTDMLLTSSQAQYWKHPAAASANWSSLNWYDSGLTATTSNRVPLPQDDVYFVAGSFTTTGKTLTIDTTNLGRNVSFTNATGTPALGVATTRIFGSLAWGTMTFVNGTINFTFMGRSDGTLPITTNGMTNAPNATWIIDTASSTTYYLADAFNLGSLKPLNLNSGTFDANDQSVTAGSYVLVSTAQLVVNMGNGTWTSTNPSAAWSAGALLTLNAEGSTLLFTGTPTANWSVSFGGKTYNNVWFNNGTSTYTITINTVVTHTFNGDFKDTGTGIHSLLFAAGSTVSVGTFSVSGSAGNLITLNSPSTATFALVKTGGGTVCSDYLSISHSVATPADTWYAGTNSINNQASSTAGSGWTFTACPAAAASPTGLYFWIIE